MRKRKWNLMRTLAGMAMFFSIISANANCHYIYHQEKMPEELKRLRRF